MKSFLKIVLLKVLPSFLYYDLFHDDVGEEDRPRQVQPQQIQPRQVESRQFNFVTAIISKQDRKYLSTWKELTFRQQEVLALACMGHRDHEIMTVLSVELSTIKGHWQLIFKKFHVRDRNEIRRALRDWDFTEWWDHRLMEPRPLPGIGTGGQTLRVAIVKPT